MKQKGDVIKRACFISLVLFSILGLTAFVGCGSGGGGGDGGAAGGGAPGTPTSFTTTSLFPLTSSWQTDNWTLFVDSRDHDFFNITTKVMADTRVPKLLYWTNDQDGLRLHGFMNDEGVKVVLIPALIVANPICRIGDIHTGKFSAGPDELTYYIECVGVEDVTVPAGTFANCMKIRVMIYPFGDQPTNYGYEMLWFADNVGFVRAEADDNNFSELFVDKGDTRELLSYHITDLDGLTEDEKALREWDRRHKEYYAAEDLNSMMTLISAGTKHKCATKDQMNANFDGLFNNFEDLLWLSSHEEVQINGIEAIVLQEALHTRVNESNGSREWYWERETKNLRKENDEWKFYGDQLDFTPGWGGVWLRQTMDGGRHQVYNPMEASFIDCSDGQYIDSKDVLASLTVTGPPGSELDGHNLKAFWEDDGSWRGFWDAYSLEKAVSGFYTLRVEEPDGGDYLIITDYLDATHRLAVADNFDPYDGKGGLDTGSVTLSWGPVEHARDYRVDMQNSTDGKTWIGMDNLYTNDTQVSVNLSPVTQYRWRVRARRFDVYWEMDSDSRSNWNWFATYDNVINLTGGYVQYRTFSDGSNAYGGWLNFTKNNKLIEESDITQIKLKDSSDNPVTISGTSFFASQYFWGGWNQSTSSVDFGGPYSDSGFSIRFPEDTDLPAGTYTYEATTSQNDILTLTRYFPVETILPVVDKASMNYEWLDDSGLHLTWSVPAAGGGYDQLRIDLYTQDGDDLLYVRLPPDKEELTIPAEWIQKMTDVINPSSAVWRIVTRSIEGGGNNYARGYSGKVDIPW